MIGFILYKFSLIIIINTKHIEMDELERITNKIDKQDNSQIKKKQK